MNRRSFITVFGGAAAAWPLAARAQQAERMRRIGVIMNVAADDPEGQARIAAFHQGLQEWGQTLGRNTRIDVRWGAFDADSSRRYATELVALAPEVILVSAAARPTCRCRRPRSTNSSSISRPPRRWASTCPASVLARATEVIE